MTTDADAGAPGHGGFCLGDMALALPMSALREVVPCGALTPLPCEAPGVIGGIDLRGVVVPVVDLRRVLGRHTPALALPSVVIMVHGGRLLGLLVERVSGVFAAGAAALHAVSVGDGHVSLFTGSLRREDDGSLVSVLSPEALSRLPRVPMADDPEPQRQLVGAEGVETVGAAASAVPVMLFRCGRLHLAIEAVAVHTTVSGPVLKPSVLAHGLCRGVVDFGGAEIPALDLPALCGLGALAPEAARQALVVQVGSGLLALLIEAVVDIVPIRPDDVVPLPRVMAGLSRLFAGALPSAVLGAAAVGTVGAGSADMPAGATDGVAAKAMPYLMIDSECLRAHDEVAALAGLEPAGRGAGQPGPGTAGALGAASASAAAGPAAGSGLQSLLVYALEGDVATPLDQVKEILPWQPDLATFDPDGPTLGVLVDRGRAIPVMCLNRIVSGRALPPTADSTVLVVECEGDWLGFVVPGLRTIETARWAPEWRAAAACASAVAGRTRRLALLGADDGERLLPVLDLLDVARTLREASPVA